jgi:GntR family transcriptional regulator
VHKAINTSTRLQQVKEYVISFVNQDQLQRNDQLPSEAAIAKTSGVSRNTVRQVYITLENKGIIVHRHGLGTLVANSSVIRDSLNEFSPFAQIIRGGGYTPNFQTLSIAFVSPDEEICDLFNIADTHEIRCTKCPILARQQPVIYVDDHVSPLFIPWTASQLTTAGFVSIRILLSLTPCA